MRNKYAILVPMRLMGIDYGSKRVGVALSDESGKMAFPHEVVKNDDQLLKTICVIVKDQAVDEIVIGHSLDKSGEENLIHQQAKELIADLTLELGIPIHLEPEWYTTQEALLYQDRNEKTDASAAAIILNAYLAKKSNQSNKK